MNRAIVVVVAACLVLALLPVLASAQCAASWAPGISYSAGTMASYSARNYQVLQAHTSQAGWEPPNVPALWSDKGACSGGATPTATATARPGATATSRARATATARPAGGVVTLYADCNFTGTQASYAIGDYATVSIGNDAVSSVRVTAGHRVTLYWDGNFSGATLALTGDDSCLTDNMNGTLSWNDRTSSFRVATAGSATPTPTNPPRATPTNTASPATPTSGGGTTPPATLTDWIGGHGTSMSRISWDANTAFYADASVNRGVIGWVQPFLTNMVNYAIQNYDPTHSYGPDKVYFFAHQSQFGGGTISSYFDAFSTFRNALDVGATSWARADNINIDRLSHEMCHIVEGSSNGIHESPAFEIWKDSKWAEICQWDFYRALGMTADADRVYNRFYNQVDSFPRANTMWFRNWFLPIYNNHGGAATLSRFFQLLAQHFPKRWENNNRNQIYTRRMNMGEFVHFYSGAARTNLKPLATSAFGWPSNYETEFGNARATFPGVTY